LRDVDFEPRPLRNILVGPNASGKSTMLDAIGLALTGRLNGRPAAEALNPFWFNLNVVNDFFAQRRAGETVPLPTITIEIFLKDSDELQRLVGAHHSLANSTSQPGIIFEVVPNSDFADELEGHLTRSDQDPADESEPRPAGGELLPTEYYLTSWRHFGDGVLYGKPKAISTATIDGQTIRTFAGVDFHMKQILDEHLGAEDKAKMAVDFRTMKHDMEKKHLSEINESLNEDNLTLGPKNFGLGMDQTRGTAWDAHVVPVIDEVPFAQSGLGMQAAVKITLAVGRNADEARVLMIEEPENHLSHTTLNQLLARIDGEAGPEQQYFVTTHSSFVLNRLGLDSLAFVTDGDVRKGFEISPESIRYFQRQPGYDSLRLVIAPRVILVEGPSDEMIVERIFADKYGELPVAMDVDVVCLRGTSFRRGLELAAALDKPCAAVRDNDGKGHDHWAGPLQAYLSDARRIFVGPVEKGETLESQIVSANEEVALRDLLSLSEDSNPVDWMTENKTDAALRIANSSESFTPPEYLSEAIEFIVEQ
jgi:hypothetical protein